MLAQVADRPKGSVLTVAWHLFAVAHLTLAATWLGSMSYSLAVVQPKVTAFFADERRREEFLITLAHGNRWPVVALIGALMLTAAAVAITSPRSVAIGYAAVLVFLAGASALFVHVSWRHWPARAFALPQELPRYHRQLRILAWTMLALVGSAFMVALSVSVGAT